jgi:hypothetical protein
MKTYLDNFLFGVFFGMGFIISQTVLTFIVGLLHK